MVHVGATHTVGVVVRVIGRDLEGEAHHDGEQRVQRPE